MATMAVSLESVESSLPLVFVEKHGPEVIIFTRKISMYVSYNINFFNNGVLKHNI